MTPDAVHRAVALNAGGRAALLHCIGVLRDPGPSLRVVPSVVTHAAELNPACVAFRAGASVLRGNHTMASGALCPCGRMRHFESVASAAGGFFVTHQALGLIRLCILPVGSLPVRWRMRRGTLIEGCGMTGVAGAGRLRLSCLAMTGEALAHEKQGSVGRGVGVSGPQVTRNARLVALRVFRVLDERSVAHGDLTAEVVALEAGLVGDGCRGSAGPT